MTTSFIAEYSGQHRWTRAGPPVGRAFTAFTVVIIVLFISAVTDLPGPLGALIGASSHLGVVATTTFAIAGAVAGYRALTLRNPWAGAVAVVLLGPGAIWSWAAFVADGPDFRIATSLVVLAAGGLAVVLLANGLRLAHWLEVFAGLGACGLALAATLVRLDPAASESSPAALLAAVSGMIALYGLLVDLEMAEYRSLVELIESRGRIEDEVSQLEELLHDLRGGLLAIEAAVGSFDGELAGPLRAEAARLRRLTLTGSRTVAYFDLVARVGNLVVARRAAGARIRIHCPGEAMVWGEESEILAIVDNLLSNAERHGRPGPIVVEIGCTDGATRLSVSNRGQLPACDPDTLFKRGMTTHPDGEGLGLARARLLADHNGAELRVGPAAAGHTSFVLNLQSRAPAAVA